MSYYADRTAALPRIALLLLTTLVARFLPAQLTIDTPATLPDGEANVFYDQTITASSGVTPYAWSAPAGLPSSLSLNPSTGRLSGTIYASGSYNFDIRVIDSDVPSGQVTQTFTLNILPALSIDTVSLPGGEVNVAYSQPLAASGGDGNYTWSLDSGPPWMSLTGGNVLSGTPDISGWVYPQVRLTDGLGGNAIRGFSFYVQPPVQISTLVLSNGEAGAPYPTQYLSAYGGMSPYTWSVVSGLPPGLTLTPSGIYAGQLSGTPTTAGPYDLIVIVQDTLGGGDSRTYNFTIVPGVVITPATLPVGGANVYYSATLTATGGSPPYNWSDGAGLPVGLTLNSDGTITGTSFSGGSFSVSATVTDGASGTDTEIFTLTLDPPLVITTAALPDGEINRPYSQTLAASGGDGTYTWSVDPFPGLPGWLSFSSAGLLSGTPLASDWGSVGAWLRITDGRGASTSRFFSFNVQFPVAIATAGTLMEGEVGAAYDQTLTAYNGVIPYSWSATGVPPGLTLFSDGRLQGTPTSAGFYTLSVQVFDDAGGSDSKNLDVNILPALSITTASLPDGEALVAYDRTLLASGGSLPHVWSTTSTLPVGLVLESGGRLHGTAYSADTLALDLRVTDRLGGTALVTLNLTILPAVQIVADALADGEFGLTYSHTFAAVDGAPPYSWSASGLPFGLSMSPAGLLDGVPNESGDFTVLVQVTDSLGGVASGSFPLKLFPPVKLVTRSLPFGVLQVAYPNTTLQAGGGVAPYTFNIAGALPPGLTLMGDMISGTPTSPGPYNITLVVIDALGARDELGILLEIKDPPLPPTWDVRGLFGGAINDIQISPDYANDQTLFTRGNSGEIYRSDDAGTTWLRIVIDPTRAGEGLNTLRLAPTFSGGGTAPDDETAFVSSGPLGVWKSVDKGFTFQSSNGVPNQGGLPCQSCANGPGASALAVSPYYNYDHTVWVGAYDGVNLGLYQSVDGGTHWRKQHEFQNSPTTAIRLIVPSPNYYTDTTLYMILFNDVYRSVNGGDSWQIIFTPPGGKNPVGLVISPSFFSNGTLFVEDNTHRVFRSQNRGDTFSLLPTRGYNLAVSQSYAITATAGGALTTLLFMKSDSPDYALQSSVNLGESFVPLYGLGMRPGTVVRESVLAAAPPYISGNIDLFSGTYVNLTASFDNGFSFVPRQQGLSVVKGTDISGAGNVIVASSEGGWLKSGDGGINWSQRQDTPGLGSNVTHVSAVSPDYANDHVIFLEAGYAGLWRSNNGGQSFDRPLFPADDPQAIAFAPGFSGTGGTMFVGAASGLLRSGDGGANFTPVTIGGNCYNAVQPAINSVAVSPDFANDGTIYINGPLGAGKGGACKSIDGGASWTQLLDGQGAPITGTLALSPNYSETASNGPLGKLVMRVENRYTEQGVYRSINAGATWTRISGQPAAPAGIIDGRVYFSPQFTVDQTAFVAVGRAFGGADGLWRSSDAGASIARLPAGDTLLTRAVRGMYLLPDFNGNLSSGSVALAVTDGAGIFRSTDGGRSFAPVTGYKFGSDFVTAFARVTGGALGIAQLPVRAGALDPPASAPDVPQPVSPGSILMGSGDEGIFQSDDGGVTLTPYSDGLPAGAHINAIYVPAADPAHPVTAVAGEGLWRLSGSKWFAAPESAGGNFTSFIEDGATLYATRTDGPSLLSISNGASWSGQDAAENDLVSIDFNSSSQPTLQEPVFRSKGWQPRAISAITASLWSVSQSGGARYSLNSGANWITANGGGDYILPAATFTTVQALGINAVTGGREVLTGTTTGLWRTINGSEGWRTVSGPGSGLEATSKNISAFVTALNQYGNTDVLVGVTGALTGGVYLSGDAGEHWTQINQGFDPSSLNISTLAKTSCTGCPVQYYTGTYGSGVYTRTIPVTPAPVVTGWCFGDVNCICGTAPGSGPVEGGQPFRLCGSNFLALPAVEFGGITAGGCTRVSSSVVTCTATPVHAPGIVSVRERNTDTRVGYMSVPYTFTGGTSRISNLVVARVVNNALLTWDCPALVCTGGAPALVYRSQNRAFTLNVETYNGGASNGGGQGTFTNIGAFAPAANASYFWVVE